MLPQYVAELIAGAFQDLPDDMQRAGTYVLNHPEDVALLSMREIARRLSLPPATLTRFAQKLGYSGYVELREQFAATMREQVSDFSDRAGRLAARREHLGEASLAQSLADSLVDRVEGLSKPVLLSEIIAAAQTIAEARRVFCLGHRSCYAPVYHFAYIIGLYGMPTRLLDAPGGIGADPLNEMGEGDVVVAAACAPYTQMTIDLAAASKERGAGIVAVTDSHASPLSRIAVRTVAIANDVGGPTSAATPIMAAMETLAALVAARTGELGRDALKRNETGFARRQVYWSPRSEAVS
jgi:DNA-binding MurR/RpiR family transcriptional regulator